MKYFWYYKRASYRTAQYNAGFFAGSCGRLKASKNKEYCNGYEVAVNRMHQLAEEANNLTNQLRKAEAHMLALHECTETWEEGYGWLSDKIHKGEPIDGFIVADLDKSNNYKNGVKGAIKAELAIERTRQATLELNRVEVAALKKSQEDLLVRLEARIDERDELKEQLRVKEKSRAEWNKVATTRLELLEGIKDQLEEGL